MNFETWFTEMKSNILWWQRTQEMYGRKDLNKVASEVHLYLIAKNELYGAVEAKMVGWRTLFQAFARKADDVTGIQLQQIGVIEPKVNQEPPLTGEARQIKLNEWYEAVQKASTVNAIPPMSRKEIQENGGWRPKRVDVREPSELEKAAALNAHIEKINAARRKLFLDAYPEAPEEEILAYIKSFEKI